MPLPPTRKVPAAVELFDRAVNGEIRLYLPSICISEARRPLQEDYQLRSTADKVRNFLRWAHHEQIVSSSEEAATRQVLDKMESRIRTDLDSVQKTFDLLRNNAAIDVFHLSQEMMEKCSELSFLKLGLEPFDQAILASVLVKAEEIRPTGAIDIVFCEQDADLQPWGKSGAKEMLTDLYDDAGIWVYGDFLLENPRMPKDWHEKRAGKNP